MRIADLSFSKKLYSTFTVIIALMIALGILFYSFFSSTVSANNWNVHTYRVIDETRALTENLINMETGLRGFAIAGNDDLLAPYRSGDQRFRENLAKIRQLTSDNPQQQARLQRLENQKADWLSKFADPLIKSRKAVMDGTITMADFTAGFMSNTGKTEMDAMRATLDEVAKTESSLLAVRTAEVEKLQVKTKTVLIGGTLIAALFAFIFATWIVRLVTPPLRQAVGLAEAIAEGDLTRSIKAKSKDEIGRLLYALANMQKKLTTIVSSIKLSTDSITSAAQEVSAGNADLSSRTEQQAASLEETAASMEELTSTVKQNADNATEANTLAVNASELADTGNNVVNRVVTIMSDINQSSTKIADITGIIEGIAFQTNILALNAAVEAARAGEQGRGFAVVASEVRTLAQRSSSAAKEIKELIGASVNKVRNGMAEADEAGRAMAQVTSAINQVKTIMSEIASASTEQGRGIEQVNQAILQMDTVTQQNAALVEQAAAAAQSLEDQGHQLQTAVATFRIQNMAQQPIALSAGPAPHLASAHKAAPALIGSSARRKEPEAQLAEANA